MPALAGRDGGAVDAVRDEETGLLCNATDQNDVSRQIVRLLNDGELKRRWGRRRRSARAAPAQWSHALNGFLDALK